MYYFNNNDYTDNNNNGNNNNNNNSPLFSQSLDPSTLNGSIPPIEFFNDHESILNDASLFDVSNNPWDFNIMPQQEAILLSEPNFLRQHQLLQDQQKEMHTRLQHDQDDGNEQQDPVLVSNLTAMFEQPYVKQQVVKIKQEYQDDEEEEDYEDYEEEEEEEEEEKKLKRHKRQQVIIKSNDVTGSKIDHQRRFNELQARFRVNYARKPSCQQVKSSSLTTPISTSVKPMKHQLLPQEPPKLSLSLPPAPFVQMNPTKALVTVPTTSAPTTPAAPAAAQAPLPPVMNNHHHLKDTRTMPIQIQRVPRPNSLQPFDAESHKKQLNNQLDKVDFNDITVSELKEMLRQRGKPATGKKAVLLQRLQEERDKSNPKGRLLSNRHSQPLPFSRSINDTTLLPLSSPTAPPTQRPRSFQGGTSSPVMIHCNTSSPSPSSIIIPGSPSSSLNRSIANMNIGSPPRRYSPYSPRLGSSPKPPPPHEYSSSVPDRYYNIPKTYKPFMSSALATPDREEDVNPFDSYYANGGGGIDPPIKEEDVSGGDMDWIDPNSFDLLLQQQVYQINGNNMDQQQQLSNDQIMAILNSQQQANAFDFKLDFNNNNNNNYHP